jgi:hypothetical protein
MIKINKDFLAGIAIGFGAGVTFQTLNGKNKLGLRQVTKSTIKFSMQTLDKLKLKIATLSEDFSDLFAEVKTEVAIEKNPEEAQAEAGQEDSKAAAENSPLAKKKSKSQNSKVAKDSPMELLQ